MSSRPSVVHTAPETADARAMRRRGATLALLTTAYFFSYLDRQILAILQELIRADLQLSDTQLGLLAGFAFALFYATLGIPVARLADRSNRVNIIAIALAAWSVMTAVCGLAQNFDQLLIARLKRKKLVLRDEIVKIEDHILPDIIA
jgi:MFS family permease